MSAPDLAAELAAMVGEVERLEAEVEDKRAKVAEVAQRPRKTIKQRGKDYCDPGDELGRAETALRLAEWALHEAKVKVAQCRQRVQQIADVAVMDKDGPVPRFYLRARPDKIYALVLRQKDPPAVHGLAVDGFGRCLVGLDNIEFLPSS